MFMVEVDFIRGFDLTMTKYEKLAHCFDERVFFDTLNLFHQISRRTHLLAYLPHILVLTQPDPIGEPLSY